MVQVLIGCLPLLPFKMLLGGPPRPVVGPPLTPLLAMPMPMPLLGNPDTSFPLK